MRAGDVDPARAVIDLLDPDLHARGDAAAAFAAVRAIHPVTRARGYWAITGHAEVVAASCDGRTFSSARGTAIAELDGPRTAAHLSDGDAHAELRARLAAAIGSGRGLVEPCAAEAAALVGAWRDGAEVDAVATLADPLPLALLARAIGDEARALVPALHRYARYDDPRYRRAGETPAACHRDAATTLWDAVGDVIAARRRAPRDDIATRLVEAGGLADDDLRYALRFLVLATYQTTAFAIAAAVVIATSHAVHAVDPARAAGEVLRVASPVIRFARTVTRDTTLGGVALAAGDRVVLFYPAANRDPRVFVDPDRVDLARAPNPHVALGAGPHACLGGHLARAQVAAALAALAHRPLSLVEPPRAIRSAITAGYDRVIVRPQ